MSETARSPVGLRTFALAIVIAAVATAACEACPNCKDSLATSPEGLNVARGYALSILIMLGMPFMLASSFGIYVWREMRRMKRDAASPEPAPPRT